MSEEKSLFEQALAVDPDVALRIALEADSTEEKRFFAYIADMNLRLRDVQEFRKRLAQRDEER